MSISALVVTLDDDLELRGAALRHLSRDPRLTLGAPLGGRVPIVAETSDASAGEELVEELFRLRGVEFVDIVLVDFRDEEA